jgi:hypothetical protein
LPAPTSDGGLAANPFSAYSIFKEHIAKSEIRNGAFEKPAWVLMFGF